MWKCLFEAGYDGGGYDGSSKRNPDERCGIQYEIELRLLFVSFRSQIPREVCERINPCYRDPASIHVESFANQEDEGVLLVRKADEQLYRLQ